jgi:hypothetical protein
MDDKFIICWSRRHPRPWGELSQRGPFVHLGLLWVGVGRARGNYCFLNGPPDTIAEATLLLLQRAWTENFSLPVLVVPIRPATSVGSRVPQKILAARTMKPITAPARRGAALSPRRCAEIIARLAQGAAVSEGRKNLCNLKREG